MGRGKLNQQERARLKRIATKPTSSEKAEYRYGANRPTEDRLLVRGLIRYVGQKIVEYPDEGKDWYVAAQVLEAYAITAKGRAVVARWRRYQLFNDAIERVMKR